jgi:hypothetical protein
VKQRVIDTYAAYEQMRPTYIDDVQHAKKQDFLGPDMEKENDYPFLIKI